jgi:hypothetical protein
MQVPADKVDATTRTMRDLPSSLSSEWLRKVWKLGVFCVQGTEWEIHLDAKEETNDCVI